MLSTEDRGDGVVVVRIDRGKVNALDLELLRAITGTTRGLAPSAAIVLTGTGTVFSAGVDLRRIVDGGPAYVREYLPALSAAFLAVFDHPGPTVAAVNGHALAGGCVLAAACDVRLMSTGTIGLTELLVGVPFPAAALEIMRYAAGPAAAVLALTGRRLSPGQAAGIGLVDAVLAPDELMDEAVRRAGELARIPATAYAMTKEQLHRPARERIRANGPLDDPAATDVWASEPALAGIARYLDALSQRR